MSGPTLFIVLLIRWNPSNRPTWDLHSATMVWHMDRNNNVRMRSLKMTGDLTRGRGTSPSNTVAPPPPIPKWVNSMPAASRVFDGMETFGGVDCVTSELHVDLRESCQTYNHADKPTFLHWLSVHNP